MGVSDLQYPTAVVSGFAVLRMLNYRELLLLGICEYGCIWKYLESVINPQIGALRKVELQRF
jgi:hypothetical protein